MTAKTDQMVEELGKAELERIQSDAKAFNQELQALQNRWDMGEEMEQWYYSCLDISGTGLMGTVEIPKIETQVPIYHGSEGRVLQIGAGHMEGSSLPVGGKDTHAVIAAHTGLAAAELFTRLDQLELGDVFYIDVLKNRMCYQVTAIETVLPTDMEYLAIEPGGDLVTLVTCTPPGINSHRLLVTGRRTESDSVAIQGIRPDYWKYAEIYLILGMLVFCGILGYLIKQGIKQR